MTSEITYLLRHKVSGEMVELGSRCELSPKDAHKHGINASWPEQWEFFTRIPPEPRSGARLKRHPKKLPNTKGGKFDIGPRKKS